MAEMLLGKPLFKGNDRILILPCTDRETTIIHLFLLFVNVDHASIIN